MAKDLKENTYIIVKKLYAKMRVFLRDTHDLDNIEKSVWQKTQIKIAVNPQSKYLYNAWRLGAIAASVLLVSLLGVTLLSDKKEIKPELVLLTNLSGANKEYILPDSSRALLRPNSQITYINSQKPTREIAFSGEAFFEIKTDESHPFVILSDGGVVRVLGTKFNLKAEAMSSTSELVLTAGSVEFLNDNSTYQIKPNQKITIDKSSGDVNIMTVDPNFELGWKADYIQFTNELLGDVLSKLADIHSVSIEIKDLKLANTRFTGRLSNGYDIDKILNDLSLITKTKYEVKGKVYIIKQN